MKINDEVIYKFERWIITDIYGNICVLKNINADITVTTNLDKIFKYVRIDNFDITPFKTLNFYYDGSSYNHKNFIESINEGCVYLRLNNPVKVYLNDPSLEFPEQKFKKNDTVLVNYIQQATIDNYGNLSSIRSINIGTLNIHSDYRKKANLYMHRDFGKVVNIVGSLVLIQFSDGEKLYYPVMMLKLIKSSKVKVKTFNPNDKYLHIKTGKIVQIIESILVTSISFAKVKIVDSDEQLVIKIKDLKLIK